MNPSISFIFVNFRSAPLIQRSLAALRAAADSQITAEYIVINNDPAERESINRIGQQSPDTRIIHTEENQGFGCANNQAAALAVGEVLFFINPDTLLVRANFLGLLAAFHFRPRAVYGMALEQTDGSREPWSAGPFPSLLQISITHIFPRPFSRPWEASSVSRTDWVSGAALAIRRDFFRALGGFDDSFFLYFEDVDLAQRAAKIDGWVGIYPFVVFQHMGGQSHESGRAKKNSYYRGQRQYFEKWRSPLEQAILALGHAIRRIF